MPDLLNEVRESEQTEKLIWRCYIIMVRYHMFPQKKVLRRHFRTIFSMSTTYVPKYSKIANLAIN